MRERIVEETFAALFALIDLRQIFRETKPSYQFNTKQKRETKRIIKRVRHSLDIIEKEILK